MKEQENCNHRLNKCGNGASSESVGPARGRSNSYSRYIKGVPVFLVGLLLLALIDNTRVSAQGVGLNNPTPDPSAILDLTASDRGLLIPRMTSAERLAIGSPAIGLLVYDTDITTFYYYDGSAWTSFSQNSLSQLSDVDTTGIQPGDILEWDSVNWTPVNVCDLFSYYFLDRDGDGYGTKYHAIFSCYPLANYVSDSSDCDDENPLVVGDQSWYADCDGDGYERSTAIVSCEVPNSPCLDGLFPDGGWSNTAGTDCDDEDAIEFPGQTWYADCDGDTYFDFVGVVACDNPTSPCADGLSPDGGWSNNTGTDCDDEDATEFPGQVWYADCDGDSYFRSSSITACDLANADASTPCADGFSPDGGWSNSVGSDCDDEDATEFPGQTWYADCDGDSYSRSSSVTACDLSGANASTPCADGLAPDGGWSNTAGSDCDDEDATEFPGQTWYADCDGDTYYRSVGVVACDNPASPCADAMFPDGGWSNSIGSDCDDEDATEFPGQTWYADCDGDTYFRSVGVVACDNPATPCSDGFAPDGGWSNSVGSDCDDEDVTEFPGQLWYADCDGDGAERSSSVTACDLAGANTSTPCADGMTPDGGWSNSIGSDCDDEDVTEFPGQTWYADCDGDSYFRIAGVIACDNPSTPCIDGLAPDGGWSNTAGSDCDDEDATEFPGQTWYADCDGDTYFRSAGIVACDNPTTPCVDGLAPDGGWSNSVGSDCDDEDATEFPGQTWYADCDGDSYFRSVGVVACDNPSTPCADGMTPDGGWSNSIGSDCDDEDVTEFPGQTWYADCDGDGYFSSVAVTACDNPTSPCSDTLAPDGGWSNTIGSDCNDENASVFPGSGC